MLCVCNFVWTRTHNQAGAPGRFVDTCLWAGWAIEAREGRSVVCANRSACAAAPAVARSRSTGRSLGPKLSLLAQCRVVYACVGLWTVFFYEATSVARSAFAPEAALIGYRSSGQRTGRFSNPPLSSHEPFLFLADQRPAAAVRACGLRVGKCMHQGCPGRGACGVCV